MDPDPDAYVDVVDPRACSHLTLDGDSRLDAGSRTLEHGEELVSARLDDAAIEPNRGVSQHRPQVVEQVAVAIAEPTEQGGGTLDIGQQHRHEAVRELDRFPAIAWPSSRSDCS